MKKKEKEGDKILKLFDELKEYESELELAQKAYADEVSRYEKVEREKEHLEKDRQRALEEKQRYFDRHKTLNSEAESLRHQLSI